MKPHKFKVLISSGLCRSEQCPWDWGLFSWVQRGWERERERERSYKLQRGRECVCVCVRGGGERKWRGNRDRDTERETDEGGEGKERERKKRHKERESERERERETGGGGRDGENPVSWMSYEMQVAEAATFKLIPSVASVMKRREEKRRVVSSLSLPLSRLPVCLSEVVCLSFDSVSPSRPEKQRAATIHRELIPPPSSRSGFVLDE